MIKKLFYYLLVLAFCLSPISAYAQSSYQNEIEGILSYVKGDLSFQEWLDGPLSQDAGSSSDGYVITLNRMEQHLDFSKYIQAASQRLQSKDFSSPVSMQRCALALISCGALDAVPDTFVDETTGALGVMSYIFGLHLLNNGAKSENWTVETLAAHISSMQRPDGGWAVMGNFSDVDATSMCLQALSACKANVIDENVIEKAVLFLSGNQLESGGFSSNGYENCESAAQLTIALSSLGIDVSGDERFIKNGNSIPDAILRYRCSSGGFSHLPDDAVENKTACIQVFQALTAISTPGVPFYDFSAEKMNPVQDATESTSGLPAWKMWALAAVGVFLLAGSIFALTRKHGRMKHLVFVVFAAACACAAIFSLNIESAESYYASDAKRGEAAGEVYLSILCDKVAGAADDGTTPDDGVILPRTAFTIYENDSVFDILTDAVRKFEIHMEHEGSAGELAYISGINHLYEYAYGELSGWMYFVNGVEQAVGCGSCIVQDGDEIVWRYTTELGEDLK